LSIAADEYNNGNGLQTTAITARALGRTLSKCCTSTAAPLASVRRKS
jgi:hypothetical protein